MDVKEIVKLYNVDGLSLEAVGKKFERSKSSVSKALVKGGYVRNKETGKYETNVSDKTMKQGHRETNVSNETMKQGNIETNVNNETNVEIKTNVSRETISSQTMVNRTYAISEKIDKAMRIKSAVEGKKPIDIVREALEAYIEQKYFDM
jgi:predicted DNA-binding protein YlxM (UPF0122 family)